MRIRATSLGLVFVLALTPPPQKAEGIEPKGYYINSVNNSVENETFRAPVMEKLYFEYKSKWLKEKRLKKAKNVSKRQNKTKAVSESDVYLLAKLIYCEVGNIKDDRCLELCGSVVLNRIKDKRYPNTLEGVIYQKGQYEVTWNGHFNYKKPDKRCLKIARKLLKNGPVNSRVNGMSERVWGEYYCRFDNVIFSIV